MKRFRFIAVAVVFLVSYVSSAAVAVDAVAAFSYKGFGGFTRLVFPADMPIDYSLKVESAGDEKYLTLASASAALFEGFSATTIEDGLVRRVDMLESEGTKSIRIFLGPQYRDYRAFMVRQPDRIVVEVVGATESKGGSGLPVVVIDAGHGGPDPGALVPSGGKEKDLCLDMAVRVRKLLEKEGMKVVMTRNADYAVSDMERVSIAHQHKGGLFLSIHVTPRPVGQDAVRTYVHDWLMTEGWVDGSAVKAEMKPYLWGIQQLPHIYRSAALAASVSGAFTEKEGSVGPAAEMAAANLIPSSLLAALDMPAVVAEVADLPDKAAGLASERYRQKAAERLARGVRAAIRKPVDSGGAN